MRFEPFRLSHRGVIAFDNCHLPENLENRLHHEVFSLVHRKCQRLKNEIIPIAVENYPWQTVAFAPNYAPNLGKNVSPVPIIIRLCNSAFEKVEIEILPLSRDPACHDLRLGVVDRAPNELVPPVFQRNDISVGRIAKNLQDFTRKDPVVTMKNSRSGFDDHSSHGKEWCNANRRTIDSRAPRD